MVLFVFGKSDNRYSYGSKESILWHTILINNFSLLLSN